MPGDVPFSELGFDFTLIDVKKDELYDELVRRIRTLIDNINKRFTGSTKLTLTSVNIVSENKAKVVVSVGAYNDTMTVNY